ncbi:hypothetical protein CS063_07015 [Sporanaerobium hydrogeniformans]|uniref:Uncharacterized protein n=1 Tax=Sporanaerobium hydrogeniformans TaxID=3072179 RepID=A0AC61DDU4_9FIRM|nr:hypothetical protein [Sporanaerobium hydrogeniformans]PHV71075.1 hypothetical protein CS063_07015 [Sporanaerobium hydrogeniformans]
MEAFYFKKYPEDSYDLEGLLCLAENEEAPLVFMLKDEDELNYIRNRYTILNYERGWQHTLKWIKQYLEQDEMQSLFIGFAALYQGKILFLGGESVRASECMEADMELTENQVYGVCVSLRKGEYVFEEVLYYDGQEKEQSVAFPLQETGELGNRLSTFIDQYE